MDTSACVFSICCISAVAPWVLAQLLLSFFLELLWQRFYFALAENKRTFFQTVLTDLCQLDVLDKKMDLVLKRVELSSLLS